MPWGYSFTGGYDVQLAHPRVFARIAHIFALHFTHGFFAIPFPAIITGLLKFPADILDPHCLRTKIRSLQAVLRLVELLLKAIKQHQLQVFLVGGDGQVTTIGVNGLALERVRQVINGNVGHSVRLAIKFADAHVKTGGDLIEHLFVERERGLGARHVLLQNAQSVVCARQHLIIEDHHSQRQHACTNHHGPHERGDPHTTGFERRDFILGRHAAKCVQRGHQHGHGQRHGNREGQRQQKELANDAPRNPLAHKVSQLTRDKLQHQQRRQCCESENQRAQMFPEDVSSSDFHRAARSVWVKALDITRL